MSRIILFVAICLIVSLYLNIAYGQKVRKVSTSRPKKIDNQFKSSAQSYAPGPNDCSECWCQCKRLSFRDQYGRVHGNCKSTHNGAQWCYVENNIGYGYSTCTDQRESARFTREAWSYHACTTPALTRCECGHCQGRRCSPSGSGAPRIYGGSRIAGGINTLTISPTKAVQPTRPTIQEADPLVEGILFTSTKEGKKDDKKIIF